MESLDAEVLARLRDAAAELLPVVVEVGPERRRLCTFVEALLDHELVLSPIAAQALPDECAWLRITPAAGTDRWCISARHVVPATVGKLDVGQDEIRLAAQETLGADHVLGLERVDAARAQAAYQRASQQRVVLDDERPSELDPHTIGLSLFPPCTTKPWHPS